MNLPIPNKTQTENISTDSQVHAALLTRLRSLPFDGYLKVVALLLGEIGYWDVRASGRRDFKGRNGRDGASGYDLLATRSSRLTLVQVKQFEADRPLFQRSIDELRGVALRAGAGEALLITTSHFSPSINRAALRSAPIAPVVTLDGVELVDLLTRHRIGVTREGELDDALFKELEAEASGNRPSDCTGSLILVTVGISKVSRKLQISNRVKRLS
jgi:restriction endonuclease Mrr